MAVILVVDDNEDNREVLSRMLEFGGHMVRTAENGRRAIEEAATLVPDLILMDLAMPEMDGWTATAHLKDDASTAEIPVIVVTGHVTSDELGRARDVGCADVVSKPIDFDDLLETVRRQTGDAAGKRKAAISSPFLR